MNDFLEIIGRMSWITRYSQTHLLKDESVLEHTGFVVLLSYFITKELIANGEDIDMGVVLSKGAIHDVDEIITGDIPRPTKYYNKGISNALKEVERVNMREISKNLSGGDEIFDDWNLSKNGKEGLIVKLVDLLAVVYKAQQEVLVFGSKSMVGHVSDMNLRFNEIDNCTLGVIKNDHVILKITNEAREICKQIDAVLEG